MASALHTRADAGFTLVELLVSLAVLGLFSLLLMQGLAAREIGLARLTRGTSDSDALTAARMMLSDRLQRAFPATNYYVRPIGPDFNGSQTQVTFLAPPRQTDGEAPLRRYQLSLDLNGDLILQSLPDLALDQKHWTDRQVLLRGVQTLDLDYFGAAAGEHTPAWRTDWRQQAFPPALVRVRLALTGDGRRRWPDLLVRPGADIDAGCNLERPKGGCIGR